MQPDIRRRPERSRYRVVLDTAAGEHRMTWSWSYEGLRRAQSAAAQDPQ